MTDDVIRTCIHGRTERQVCAKCNAMIREQEKEDAARCPSCAALRAEVERLREENMAFVEELKCYHDGNDGTDSHWCVKCDSRVTSADTHG